MKASSWNCCCPKEHNWWPLIPLSAGTLTEVRLNSCTVHSAQRYTWSSVHCVGSAHRGGGGVGRGWGEGGEKEGEGSREGSVTACTLLKT